MDIAAQASGSPPFLPPSQSECLLCHSPAVAWLSRPTASCRVDSTHGKVLPSHEFVSHCLSYLLLGQNTQHPQVEGRKVYFSSQCGKVSMNSQLAPRQGSMAGSMTGRQEAVSSEPVFFLSLYVPSRLQSYCLVPPMPNMGFHCPHLELCPPVSLSTALTSVSHTHDPATSPV